VQGSLQTQLLFDTGSFGFNVGGAVPAVCRSFALTRSPKDTTRLLMSFTPIDTFRVTLDDGRVLDVPAGTYPGLPNDRFATARGNGTVECIGGQP
jgi:hypothetical protein